MTIQEIIESINCCLECDNDRIPTTQEDLRTIKKALEHEKLRKKPIKTLSKIEIAENFLTQNNICYKVCNVSTGQINVYTDNECLTYYANTGKIQGYTNVRGIEAFIKLCKKGVKTK